MSNPQQAVLGEYRGKPILTTSVAIIKAGDGLSKSMSIEPHIYEIGDDVYVLMKCKVADHRPRPIDKAPSNLDVLMRFEAETVTIVDEEFARDRVERQRQLIQEHADREAGRQSLLAAEEMMRAHQAGQHADKTMPGCPECDAEIEAVAREEAEFKAAQGDAPVPIKRAGRKAAAAKKAAPRR